MGAQWKQQARAAAAAATATGRILDGLAKEIAATRDGADRSTSPRLRVAIEATKKTSTTEDTLERAIGAARAEVEAFLAALDVQAHYRALA
ncbi:MAG: hypothetical protein OHK0013_02900 [Sandaracinaceae bacterium]